MRPYEAPSPLPYGVPDFENVDVKEVRDALKRGMVREAELWEDVASNPEEPTVANTLVPIDLGDGELERASSVFYTLSSSVGGEQWEDLQEELAPQLAAHEDKFWLNDRLYRRYVALSKIPDLDEESAWLVRETLLGFRLSGIDLDEDGRAELRDLNRREAELDAAIDRSITKQLQTTGTAGDDLPALEGLTEQQLRTAKEEGAKRGVSWWLGVANYTQPPLIASLKKRATRAAVLRDSVSRGFTGEEGLDTREAIIELADVRARRAHLLGYPNHASLTIEEETAPSPEAATQMLEGVAQKAKERLDFEAQTYVTQAAEEGTEFGPEDWLFYEEQARSALLGVDSEELSAYFPLSQVVEDGVFYAANQIYGLTFTPRPDIRGWADEVVTWQVNGRDGRPIGLFMADYYARDGKSGGAWMAEVQPACGLAGTAPIITNNANFRKQPDGGEALLNWDQVETCFHEFGHALHGLLSNTFYNSTAGTDVARDFVELPSQLNEMWAYHPKVLANFARHHETGEPLAGEVAQKLREAKQFGQAFMTLEYVQAALIDQAWHGEGPRPSRPEEVELFEAETLSSHGADHPLVWPRYRTPYFAHAFAGGYDSTYYSYMWAEAMVAELEQWFMNDGDDFDVIAVKGDTLTRELLSKGNARDPLESFLAVAGRMPEAQAVASRRGLG